jgi:PPOX class probable F420-dependent enzyme
MSQLETDREQHLAKTVNAVLATIRRDGTVQVSPNWYLWTGESLLISTVGWTAKVHNIRRDPRVTVCIDDPDSGRYVAISGAAALVEDGSVRDLTLALIGKYVPEVEVRPHWDRINRNNDRLIIKVQPTRFWWRRGY